MATTQYYPAEQQHWAGESANGNGTRVYGTGEHRVWEYGAQEQTAHEHGSEGREPVAGQVPVEMSAGEAEAEAEVEAVATVFPRRRRGVRGRGRNAETLHTPHAGNLDR